jgi:oligopeptidase B
MNIANMKPPVAEKRPRIETWHGFEKRDDYHWLKAANWQEVMRNPSVTLNAAAVTGKDPPAAAQCTTIHLTVN